jgi:hypothetical protein
MTATNTNKQPVFVDRPLIARTRLTNQVVGSSATVEVQGGQSPALLLDMDASLSSDNNSGGIVDSVMAVRDDINVSIDPDYVVDATTSGSFIGLTSGQVVYVTDSGLLSNASSDGAGYYTYTGAVSGNTNTEIVYSGGTVNGFTYTAPESGVLPAVTLALYHTRGTTVPIPADGDYHLISYKTIQVGEKSIDFTDVLPELSIPVPQAGNTTGLGEASPLRNRSINLQRGDRLYIGVVQRGAQSASTGYVPGIRVTAQGGYY